MITFLFLTNFEVKQFWKEQSCRIIFIIRNFETNPEARISNQMNLMKNEKNSSKMFSRPTTRRIGEMNIRLLAMQEQN